MRAWLVITVVIVAIFALGSPLGSSDLTKIIDQISKIQPLLLDNGKVGNLFSESIDKQYGISTNPKEVNRLQNVGRKLVSANHLKPYDFQILNNFEFNACSIYGNKIRAFAGLMRDTQNSDAELSAVIAHEIAHQELGHNKKSVETFKITYALDMAKIKLPKTLQLAANAVLAKRSRDDEEAADSKALNYLVKANIPIKGAVAVFRRIEAEHKIEQKKYGNNLTQQHFSQIFATHPNPDERAKKAEDALFLQKYGKTFREVEIKSSTESLQDDSRPIIMAHPSLWNMPLSDEYINRIWAMGIFNPSPLTLIKKTKDIRIYLDYCLKHRLIGVTCDNDSHGYFGKETDNHFTFIESNSTKVNDLIQAIKLGHTYASADGTEIRDQSFAFGFEFPKVRQVVLSFRLISSGGKPLNNVVTVFRNGKRWQTIKSLDGKYSVIDDEAREGKYWYNLYVEEKLFTSPITVTVTNDKRDKVIFARKNRWQKGLVHYHSFYSDGITKSIQKIWDSAVENGVKFLFMTDHADRFDERKYARYVGDCARASESMIPGFEYPLGKVKDKNHLLFLDRATCPSPDKKVTAKKTLIIQGPFHLGDDFPGSEIERDAAFEFGKTQATLKLRIKGSPFKDPILWVNRHEIGRVVTTDNKWHWYEFSVPAKWLRNGQNLFHIESFIPDRWHTFDDCEVADIYIYPSSS